MTVSSQTNKAIYIGNGVATEFAIPFSFLEQEHIKVRQKKNDIQTERTDWEISGGNIVFKTAPESGAEIAIVREVPLTQETDYRDNEILHAETLERNFDKLTMQVQQLAEKQDRAVTVDIFDDTQAAELIPSIRKAVSDCAKSVANASMLESETNALLISTTEQARAAANSATNAATSETNTAAMLGTKANTDLSNCTRPYLVETWRSGSSWYRVWSDGFIEQGGYAVEGIANVDYGLALLKPYTADYTLIADVSVYTRGDGYNYFATTHAASLTHATVYTRGHAGTVDSRGFTWRAVGY